MVLADETANPRFVAADLLSQAEHDEICICDPCYNEQGFSGAGIKRSGRFCGTVIQKRNHSEVFG